MSKKSGFNDYIVEGNIVKIRLRNKQGKELFGLIDLRNLQFLIDLGIRWYARYKKSINSYYVQGNYSVMGRKVISLHQLILNYYNSKSHIDHKNRNSLDNRRKNLRITGASGNTRNRKSKNRNNTSGYRNVTWMDNHWRIQLQINGKNTLLPEKFDDVDLAGKFAEKMRKKYYREFSGNS